MEVDFWGVKSSGCDNSLATELKCSNIPQKSQISYQKEVKWTWKPQKIQKFPASIPHFPAETTFGSKLFHNTYVVRGFSKQWKWKPQNFDFRGFDVYFAYFSVWNFICQIRGLIGQAKRSPKIPIFFDCGWTIYNEQIIWVELLITLRLFHCMR
jgi:hypothetical protein